LSHPETTFYGDALGNPTMDPMHRFVRADFSNYTLTLGHAVTLS
jgi:hypothetical protein